MSESKFRLLQAEVCEPLEPELAPPADRVCPTCIPNENLIEPNWWEIEEPWLNEKTCEYTTAVFINEDGKEFALSDIKTLLEGYQTLLDSLEQTTIEDIRTEGVVGPEDAEGDPSVNVEGSEEVFAILRRTYIKPGIRQMIRHFNKKESDEIICASIDSESIDAYPWLSAIHETVGLGGLGMKTTLGALAAAATGVFMGTVGPVAGIAMSGVLLVQAMQGKGRLLQATQDMDLEDVKNKVADTALNFVESIQNWTENVDRFFDPNNGSVKLSCGSITHLNINDFLITREQLINTSQSGIFKTFDLQEQLEMQYREITNMNALELYAKADDYHFYGLADNVIAVKVTIPAHIFDQIPDDPQLPEVNTSAEEVIFHVVEFSSWISQLRQVIRVFKVYQSYFYQYENGMIYHKDPLLGDIEKPFYWTYLDDQLENFEKTFENYLSRKGYIYNPYGFSKLLAFFSEDEAVEQIKFVFNKDDPTKPFTLAEKGGVEIKNRDCGWNKLHVREDSPLRTMMDDNQTLATLIANLKDINNSLKARQTPPWLDFTAQYIYPPIYVNYGSSELLTDRTATNCLQDELNKIGDFILDEALSFSQAFAYQMNKNACKALVGDRRGITLAKGGNPKVLEITQDKNNKTKVKLTKEFKRLFGETKKKETKNPTKARSALKKVNKQEKKSPKPSKSGLAETISKLSPCNWKKATLDGIKCLLNGMTLEDGYRTILKSILGTMASEFLETLIASLPYDKQEKIRELAQSEFEDMPAPWEVGWNPGNVDSSLNRMMADEISEHQSSMKNYGDFIKRYEELTTNPGIEGLVQKYLSEETNETNKLHSDVKKLQADLSKLQYDLRIAMASRTTYENRIKTLVSEYNNAWSFWQSTQTESYLRKAADLEAQVEENEKKLQKNLSDYGVPADGTIVLDVWSWSTSPQSQPTGKFAEEQQLKDQIKELENQQKSKGIPTGFDTSEVEGLNISILKAKEEAKKKELEAELVTVRAKIVELSKESGQSEADIDIKLATANYGGTTGLQDEHKKSFEYAEWDKMNAKDKEKAIQKYKDKQTFISMNPGDPHTPGTFGKAVGNVQKALHDAYVDAIMNTADVQELLKAVNDLPGATVIADFVASMDCPNTHFVYPPISSFLNTLTLDPCGDAGPRVALPKVKKIPGTWHWLKAITYAFGYAIRESMRSIMGAIITKLASVLEASLCKSLAAGGGLLGTVNTVKSNTSFMDIIDDVICGDQLETESDRDKALKNFFAGVGVGPMMSENFNAESPRNLVETLSKVGSVNDYKRAMVSSREDQDEAFLTAAARAIKLKNPEYAAQLGNADALAQMLMVGGNFLSPDQRQQILDDLNNPQDDYPLEASICLTKEEKDAWDDERRSALSPFVGDDIANDWIDRLNERTKSDLEDLTGTLVSDPFANALDDLLQQTNDPDCKLQKSLINYNNEFLNNATQTISRKLFKRLSEAFADDTIHQNIFETGFGLDAVGILITILGNKVGYNLNLHSQVRNNFLINILARIGLFDHKTGYPDTVGLQMYMQLLDQDISYEINSDFQSTIKLTYSNTSETQDEADRRTSLGLPLGGFRSNINSIDNLPDESENSIRTYAKNFDYKLTSNNSDYDMDLHISKPMTLKQATLIDNMNLKPSISELQITPYKYLLFQKYINKMYSNVGNASFSLEQTSQILNKFSIKFNNKIKNSLLTGNGTGDQPFGLDIPALPQGFVHGGTSDKIYLDDLTYVDPVPGATSYTHAEEDRVLGKSMTDNPRVKFLNPDKYGGSWKKPNYNITNSATTGWMALSNIINPAISGCPDTPSGENILRTKELEDKLMDNANKITRDERLSKAPDCVQEKPFDKIASPDTLATLEAIVRAAVRVHLSEFLIYSLPIHSNLILNSKNYDEAISEIIVDRMRDSLQTESSFVAITYEAYTYWLLFLEQAAQVVGRQVEQGEIEMNEELEEIFETLDDVQHRYHVIMPDELHSLDNGWAEFTTTAAGLGATFTFNEDIRESAWQKAIRERMQDNVIMSGDYSSPEEVWEDIASQQSQHDKRNGANIAADVLSGILLVGYNNRNWYKEISEGDMYDFSPFTGLSFGFQFLSLNYARFLSKVYTISKFEKQCSTLLKYIVKQELDSYGEYFATKMLPRPYIYDISKYLIGASNMAEGKSPNAGLYDIEVPIGSDGNAEDMTNSEYGEINHCSPDGNIHPLSLRPEVLGPDSNIQEGGYYLEKYLRITTKDSSNFELIPVGSDKKMPIPNWINERDYTLNNVVNINKFNNWLNLNTENIQKLESDLGRTLFISDIFGNAKIRESSETSRPAPSSIGETNRTELNPAITTQAVSTKMATLAGSSSSQVESDALYDGTIGIKFGVRLCMVSPEDVDNPFGSTAQEATALENAKKEKSYILNPLGNSAGSKYSFPIVTYEIDVADSPLTEYLGADDNFNQNLKCHVDRLAEMPEFDLLFDKIFDVKKLPSMLMLYSYTNFIPSLMLGTNERVEPDLPLFSLMAAEDVGDPPPSSDDRGKSFNDCKAEIRKLFVSNYKRSDFDPPNEEYEFDFFNEIMRKLMAESYMAVEFDELVDASYKKRLRRDQPTDSEGKPCKNGIASLFNLKFN